MKVIIDTSIWIEFLRGGATGVGLEVDALLGSGSVLLCGPVVSELAAGVSRSDRAALLDRLAGIGYQGLDRTGWILAGEIKGDLRERGLTLPLTDIAIAASAISAGAAVWSKDADFGVIAGVRSDLALYEQAA